MFQFPYRRATDFEEVFCKFNGFATADEYRREVGAHSYVKDITIPVIYYFSFDDPLIGTNSIAFESIHQNENCVLTSTHFGSHLCCFDRLLVNRQWMCEIGVHFFQTFQPTSSTETSGPTD